MTIEVGDRVCTKCETVEDETPEDEYYRIIFYIFLLIIIPTVKSIRKFADILDLKGCTGISKKVTETEVKLKLLILKQKSKINTFSCRRKIYYALYYGQ